VAIGHPLAALDERLEARQEALPAGRDEVGGMPSWRKLSMQLVGPWSTSAKVTRVSLHASALVWTRQVHRSSAGRSQASTRMTMCSSRPAKPKRNSPPGSGEPVTIAVHQPRRPSRVAIAAKASSRETARGIVRL
jgi:hypothetical protein